MTFTIFQPNCTVPPAPVDFVADASLRSTLGIVWSCISTIIACTYSSLHLNVIPEEPETSQKKSWWRNPRWGLRNQAVGIVVGCFAVLVPEWILLVAFVERLGSEYYYSPKWTTRLRHYARMGGFRLCLPATNAEGGSESETKHEEVMIHDHTLWWGMLAGKLPSDPPLSEREVDDLSKQSSFAKFLVMSQIIWFAINFIVRLSRSLPLAQLEIGTAAFIVVSLPIWGVYLNKPKDVQFGTRIFVQSTQGEEPVEESSLSVDEQESVYGKRRVSQYHLREFNRTLNEDRGFQESRVRSFKAELRAQLATWDPVTEDESMPALVLATLPGILFGAVHVAAWNASFPSSVDKWLWRAAAVTTMLPLLVAMLFFFLPPEVTTFKARWIFGSLPLHTQWLA